MTVKEMEPVSLIHAHRLFLSSGERKPRQVGARRGLRRLGCRFFVFGFLAVPQQRKTVSLLHQRAVRGRRQKR